MEDNRITVLGSLRYFRDEAGAFLASFWMILAIYALGGWLLWVWLNVDAAFSRPLAGDVIPAEVTQHFSWTILGFSTISGMATIWCHYHGMKGWKRLLQVLTVGAAALLLTHAYGLSAKIMEGQYSRAEATAENGQTQTNTAQARIDAINDQIAGIERRTLERVATLQESIDSITTDGLDNDHLADGYRDAQTQAQDRAETDIAGLELQKASLLQERGSKRIQATSDASLVESFNPLFTVMARISSNTWDPAEDPPGTHQYASGLLFFTVFWGFGKLLMMVLFTLGFAMQQQAAKDARGRKQSADDALKAHSDSTIGDKGPSTSEPEQAPEPDPRADWTEKQWNSLKGADARKFREETTGLNKLRVPAVLRSTATPGMEAAE